MNENIITPDKSHFKINEICAMTSIKPYVLRFWESEFPEISPIISSTGQKLYEHKDIEVITFIKDLLFEKKMTIEQAKAEVKFNTTLPSQQSPEKIETPPLPKGIDRQMLMAARKKLHALVSLTQSLKERHHW